MSSPNIHERVDTLLALALTFDGGPHEASARAREGVEEGDAEDSLDSALRLFDACADATRQAALARAEWYTKLSREKRAQWRAQTLARVRFEPARPDEHIHPTHIVEALGEEPTLVQNLALRNLPPVLAATCAAALHFRRQDAARGAREPMRGGTPDARGESRAGSAVGDGEPVPEVVALVRRVFLSRFVSSAELDKPTQLDLLTGVEVARLVRLLGVRETAVACRAFESAEDIGSFLWGFSAEDAGAIAEHLKDMVILPEIEQQRVAFAHQLLKEALAADSEPEAMLDLLGMRLLAVALWKQGTARVSYTAQKIPLLAANALKEMIADSGAFDRGVVRQIAKETEAIAHGLRRSRRETGLPEART